MLVKLISSWNKPTGGEELDLRTWKWLIAWLAFDLLTEKGMTITELTPEEEQKFVKQVQPVYKKYSSQIGEEFVNELLESVK